MNDYRPDTSTTEWRKQKEWLVEQLGFAHEKLAGLDLSEKETQQLRGQIVFIKKLLSLEMSRPPARSNHESLYEQEINNR